MCRITPKITKINVTLISVGAVLKPAILQLCKPKFQLRKQVFYTTRKLLSFPEGNDMRKIVRSQSYEINGMVSSDWMLVLEAEYLGAFDLKTRLQFRSNALLRLM